MSLREIDSAATPASPPLTRREARALEALAATPGSAIVPVTPAPIVVAAPAAFETATLALTAAPAALAAATPVSVVVAAAIVATTPPVREHATSAAHDALTLAALNVPATAATGERPETPHRATAPRMAPHRPAAAPRTTRPSRAAVVSRKLLSVGAMVFAGALLVGLSVPANAFITDVDTFAPEEIVAAKLPGQSIAVPAEATAQVLSRDSYEVVSWAEQLRIKYGNMSSSYSATTGAIRWPFPYSVTITDRFGERPSGTSGTSHHNGVDFTPGEGTPIYAIADGVVAKHDENTPSYGNAVYIQHDIGGQNIQSLYAHMLTGSSPLVPGAPIKVGDFVGLVGNTGASYGAHLHLEIQLDGIPIDPFAWLTANAVN